jgi:hypothetical protein
MNLSDVESPSKEAGKGTGKRLNDASWLGSHLIGIYQIFVQEEHHGQENEEPKKVHIRGALSRSNNSM